MCLKDANRRTPSEVQKLSDLHLHYLPDLYPNTYEHCGSFYESTDRAITVTTVLALALQVVASFWLKFLKTYTS